MRSRKRATQHVRGLRVGLDLALVECPSCLATDADAFFAKDGSSSSYPRASYPVGRTTGYWTHPQPPWHLYQFSVATLAQLVNRAGFRVTEVVHQTSPTKYTLAPEGFRVFVRKPARALYAALFLPFLLLGPHIGRGDQISLVAVAT